MARVLAVEAKQSVGQLRALAHVERDARVRCRLLAIAFVQSGHSAYEGDGLFGLSAVQIRQWVKRYNSEGIDGLSDRPRPGARPRLSTEQEAVLLARLHAGPPAERGLAAWRGVSPRRTRLAKWVRRSC